MNRLYKTYILLRDSVKQSITDDKFGARIKIKEHFDSLLSSYESQHFEADIKSKSDAYASIGMYERYLFNTYTGLDIEVEDKYGITTPESLPTQFNLLYDDETVIPTLGILSAEENNFSYNITISGEIVVPSAFIFNIEGACLFSTNIPLDFNLEETTELVNRLPEFVETEFEFNDEVVIPSATILTASNYNFATYITLGDVVRDLFETHSYFADLIDYNIKIGGMMTPSAMIISSAPYYFSALAIFTDEIEVATTLQRFIAEEFTSEVEVEGDITSEANLTRYYSRTLRTNVIVDGSITSTACIGFAPIDFIMTYWTFDDELFVLPDIETYEATFTKANVGVDYSVLTPTVGILSCSELNFITGFIFDDEILPTIDIGSYEAQHFESETEVDGSVTPDVFIFGHEAEPFSVWVPTGFEATATACIGFIPTDPFRTFILTEGEIDATLKLSQYSAQTFLANIPVDGGVTATAGLLAASPNSFIALVPINLDSISPKFGIDSDPAYFFRPNAIVDGGVSPHTFISDYLPNKIDVNIIDNLNYKATACIGFAQRDLFNFYAVFSEDDDIYPTIKTSQSPADLFKENVEVDGGITPNAYVLSGYIENFIMNAIFDDSVVDPELYVLSTPATLFNDNVVVDGGVSPNTNINITSPDLIKSYISLDDFKIDVSADVTVTAVVIEPFSFYAVFTDEILVDAETISSPASMFKMNPIFDDFFDAHANIPTYAASDVLLDFIFDDSIIPSADVVSSEANIFATDIEIDDDSLFNSEILDYVANKFDTDIIVDGGVTPTLDVLNAESSIFGLDTDSSLNIDMFAEVDVSTNVCEFFNFLATFTDEIYPESQIQTATSDALKLDNVEDILIDVFTQLTDCEQASFEYNMSSDFEDVPNYEVDANTSNGFITNIEEDSNVEFNYELNSYSSEHFKSESTIGIEIDTSAYVDASSPASDVFYYNDEITSALDAEVDLYTSELMFFNEEYEFDFDSTADACTAEMIRYDWPISSEFDSLTTSNEASSLETEVDIACDVDFFESETNAYIANYIKCDTLDVSLEVNMSALVNVMPTYSLNFATYVPVNFEIEPTALQISREGAIFKTDLSEHFEYNLTPFLLAGSYNGFKTTISNTVRLPTTAYFIYATYAKLNEYNASIYTLNSMGSQTMNELSYHKYSYN